MGSPQPPRIEGFLKLALDSLKMGDAKKQQLHIRVRWETLKPRIARAPLQSATHSENLGYSRHLCVYEDLAIGSFDFPDIHSVCCPVGKEKNYTCSRGRVLVFYNHN